MRYLPLVVLAGVLACDTGSLPGVDLEACIRLRIGPAQDSHAQETPPFTLTLQAAEQTDIRISVTESTERSVCGWGTYTIRYSGLPPNCSGPQEGDTLRISTSTEGRLFDVEVHCNAVSSDAGIGHVETPETSKLPPTIRDFPHKHVRLMLVSMGCTRPAIP
jgi:hypothetical protein